MSAASVLLHRQSRFSAHDHSDVLDRGACGDGAVVVNGGDMKGAAVNRIVSAPAILHGDVSCEGYVQLPSAAIG